MVLRRCNALHVTLLEVRGLPAEAARLVLRACDEETPLAELSKGKLKEGVTPAAVTLVGPFDCREAVWVHALSSGLMADTVGSCMLLLPLLDLGLRPYVDWIPLLNKDGGVVGRAAVEIFADHTRRLGVTVVRGVCDPTDGDRLGGATEPKVVMKVREQQFATGSSASADRPAFDARFEVVVGFRDKATFQVLDQKPTAEPAVATEVAAIDLLSRIGQYMWVPILDHTGAHAGKVLLQLEEVTVADRLPLRVLRTEGLDASRMKDGKAEDIFVRLTAGKQEFKTTAKDNTADPVWDEEFEVDILPHQFLHAYVKSKGLLQDTALGEALVPAKELATHIGEQVWVTLSNTPGLTGVRLLLWVCPPPGSVYPDPHPPGTAVALVPPLPPDDADGDPRLAPPPPPPVPVPAPEAADGGCPNPTDRKAAEGIPVPSGAPRRGA
jgi:hypothetical protein